MEGSEIMKNWNKIETTSKRLQEAMRITKLKQADLSRLTGLSKGGISNYVLGRYEPKSDIINKLAIALNVSEMWLWGYDVPMERNEQQKKNDALVDIIVRLRSDENFADVVRTLNGLTPEQFESVKHLLSAFSNK